MSRTISGRRDDFQGVFMHTTPATSTPIERKIATKTRQYSVSADNLASLAIGFDRRGNDDVSTIATDIETLAELPSGVVFDWEVGIFKIVMPTT